PAKPAQADAGTPAAPAGPAAGSVEDRLLRAEKLYKDRKYVESARELEQLWGDTKQPNALYNAALARFAAGHYAHTIHYLDTYVAEVKEAPPEALDLAKFQSAKARERSVDVPLMIGPPAALVGGATLVVRRIPDKPEDQRPDLTFTLPPGNGTSPSTRTIPLDPGRWSAEVSARGYVSTPQEIVITKGKPATGVNFVMTPDPKLRSVSIRVDVPADAKADQVLVRLQAAGGAGEPKTCTIRPYELNECKLLVETGAWEISAEAAGFVPFRQVVTLTAGTSAAAYTLPMHLAAPPPPPLPVEPPSTDVVPKSVRLRLAGGLNAGGLPLFVTGLGLAVYGSNRYDKVINSEASECDSPSESYQCRGDTISAIRFRTAGLALVGTATGLFVTGLTAEFDVKPRVWYAELGVGGALLVGGAGWLGATNGALAKQLNVPAGGTPPVWADSIPAIDKATNQRLAASMLMGTGLGLVTGSTIGLLVRRHYASKGRAKLAASVPVVGPYTNVGQLGLMVQGRF
ncbi:MAG TPA: hypothetical protein PKW35_17545, partial [Nannocystaceae bacterium]|nr:hypothetical protein [Nannocystaceae bacterium]